MQIRLNQRNHRQRKENLIESLQAQNQQLKAALHECPALLERVRADSEVCPHIQGSRIIAPMIKWRIEQLEGEFAAIINSFEEQPGGNP